MPSEAAPPSRPVVRAKGLCCRASPAKGPDDASWAVTVASVSASLHVHLHMHSWMHGVGQHRSHRPSGSSS